MSDAANSPTWQAEPGQPKGQPLAARARQLLNRLEFDESCGGALQGDDVIVSVVPAEEVRDDGCFRIVVSCHARTAQAVTWSTLRVYAVPKNGSAFGLLGPSLDRLGHATIDRLPAGEYRLRAYHRAGNAPFELKPGHDDETPFLKAVNLGGTEGMSAPSSPEWTVLPPEVCSQDGITLHRSLGGNRARLHFSGDDEGLVGAQVEFCVVLRSTGEQLVTRQKDLRRASQAHVDAAVCQTEPFEFGFPPDEALDVCYRIVAAETGEQC